MTTTADPALSVVAEPSLPPSRFLDLVEESRIRGRIYSDPQVFDDEMDRIFHRSWVYVAHETEIPNHGDFKTTAVGTQPIIVVRDHTTGELQAMYNRCRHRGATVCEEREGTTRFFKCPYHNWTYRSDGELVAVPFKEDFGPDFDTAELGLVHVARIESYRGFIFARLAEEGPELIDHLGHARPYLDRIIDQGDGIQLTAGVHRNLYPGNWKLQQENTVDNYHAGFVHGVYFDMLTKRSGQKISVSGNADWKAMDLGNGHAAIDFGAGLALDFVGDEVTFNLQIFPNLNFVGTQVRVNKPVTVESCMIEMYPTVVKGFSDEKNNARLRGHEDFFGPAGFGSPDDNEVAFRRLRLGIAADVGDDWCLMGKGLHHEEIDERGVRIGAISDETTMRAIYRAWREAMSR
jgi:phenylpropionate dioxygenase-like ring-hydroxylating dioxygenase large terminal subunit